MAAMMRMEKKVESKHSIFENENHLAPDRSLIS